MPRKATGQLIWYASGWHARYPATVDGERKSIFVDLGTKNEVLAKRKLAALVDEGNGATIVPVETFERAAARVYLERATNQDHARFMYGFLRKHAFPIIGRIRVDEIGKADVISVLEAVRDAKLSDQTIAHVRNAISIVYRHLRREQVVTASPLPSAEEIPECLPEAIDDRPKAVLSDDELLVYLAYTDKREGERYRGGVRERQMMALLSRCVGGMRTGELHGLTWARVRAEGERFDALEVIRYKTRRKASRRGSRAVVRQLYPLGDTVLPLFLRYWWVRSGRPAADDSPVFPVRRAKRLVANDKGERVDRLGERRHRATWAVALRRDLRRAFEAATAAGVEGVPQPNSRRWAELFDGTEDRRPLWFHNSRNVAAVVAERFERLKAAAKFTGHASGRMLQHYREMAGEVDVVPVSPEIMPEAERLLAVLRAWCEVERIDLDGPATPSPDDASSASNEYAYGTRTREESPQISELLLSPPDPQSTAIATAYDGGARVPKLAHYQAVLHPVAAEPSAEMGEAQGSLRARLKEAFGASGPRGLCRCWPCR